MPSAVVIPPSPILTHSPEPIQGPDAGIGLARVLTICSAALGAVRGVVTTPTKVPSADGEFHLWTLGTATIAAPRCGTRAEVVSALRSAGGGAVVATAQTDAMPDIEWTCRTMCLDAGMDAPAVGRRAITSPFLVPAGFPPGRYGLAAGETGAAARLLLVAWDASVGEMASLVDLMDRAFRADPARDIEDARSCLERMSASIDRERISHATALRGWQRLVEDLEEAFYEGENLSGDDLSRIEHALRELVAVKGRMPSEALEIERLGLESRLVRLRDARAARDAQGVLPQVLGALTALVLVPTLVSGTFGANVAVPLRASSEGWSAMLAFMASGSVLSFAAIASYRQVGSRAGGRFLPHAPGHPDRRARDPAWRISLAFVWTLGAAGTTIATAIGDLRQVGLFAATSTTALALWAVGAAVIGMAFLAVGRDVARRGVAHATVDVASAVAGSAVAYAALEACPSAFGAATAATVLLRAAVDRGPTARWLARRDRAWRA